MLLGAKSVAYIDPKAGGSSGIYFDKLLDRLGIGDQIRPKAKLKQGGYVAELVVSGEAEVAIHQISEIVPVKGAVLVGPLPAEVQNFTTYSAGLGAAAKRRSGRQGPHPIHRRPGLRPDPEDEGHGQAVAALSAPHRRIGQEGVHDVPHAVPVDAERAGVREAGDNRELLVFVGEQRIEAQQLLLAGVAVVLGADQAHGALELGGSTITSAPVG